MLIEEALKTSEIEGEYLDPNAVRSSVAQRLGLPAAGMVSIKNQQADGVVQILMDATHNFRQALSPERLFGWHAALFPTGYSGMQKINVASWRDDLNGPMKVESGPVGREKIHYQAPPAKRLEKEMIRSLSSQVMAEREDYYRILERTNKGEGDITDWMKWFLECMSRAILSSNKLLADVMLKAQFWKHYARTNVKEGQSKVFNRLLDAGPGGFEGGLTHRKYAGMTHVSRATAQRELSDLVQKGILRPNPGGGRSTSYDLGLMN